MRTFSIFSIFLLCLAILIIDILAFYWLDSITDLLDSPNLKIAIEIAFWVFTIGLISSILILKVRLDDINPRRKQWLISRFYGLAISSFIPKLIFVIIISILYFTNFVFLETESLIVVPVIGLISGVLPFVVILYGIFSAAYRFKLYHQKINFKNLPPAFSGTRIIHVSDFHLGSFNYRYKVLSPAIEIINRQNPDYIFFTGDLVNNFAWELKGWEKVLSKLKAKKGKYAVLGNHDYGDYSKWPNKADKLENKQAIIDFFKTIGFQILLNSSQVVENNGDKISIVGVENWGQPPFKQYGNLKNALKGLEGIDFKILLSHDPTHWAHEIAGRTNIALTLSGHTHGMQAGIQYKGFSWSPIKYKYQHWGGLYKDKENDQYLYVNRGLGWLGFPGRLGMRPEITAIEIKRS